MGGLRIFKKYVWSLGLELDFWSSEHHSKILKKLKKEPILDLKLRLGEGSGAAVATLILKAALATHNGMATFTDAKISRKY